MLNVNGVLRIGYALCWTFSLTFGKQNLRVAHRLVNGLTGDRAGKTHLTCKSEHDLFIGYGMGLKILSSKGVGHGLTIIGSVRVG